MKLSPLLRGLHRWYLSKRRILPWREEPTPYRVWVSEIMLQQTQVSTVIPYFEKFMDTFPNVKSLAMSSEDAVMAHWSGLGYYRRARFLHEAAKAIVSAGRFPDTLEGWLAVKGVGRYTAGAVLSIAYDQPISILDGNVERVLSRFYALEVQGLKLKQHLWEKSEAWINQAFEIGIRPSEFNQALMELGARACTPKNPKCEDCPFLKSCKAFSKGIPTRYPLPPPKKKWVRVEEEMVHLFDGRGRFLLIRDPHEKWRRGCWDFPKVEEGTKLGTEKLWKNKLWKKTEVVKTRHVVTRHKITRTTYLMRVSSEEAARKEVRKLYSRRNASLESESAIECKWVREADLDQLPVSSALRKTFKAVRGAHN